MAAPARLSSGSAPEPVAEATAEPQAAEAVEPQAVEPEVAEPETAEPELTEPEPELTAAEPELTAAEPELTAAEPEPEAEGPPPASREPRGRRLVAVVSVVAGAIVLVSAAVAALAVVTHGFRPKTVVTYRPAAVFGLRAGECINSSPNGLSVTIKSCTTPHDAEVFATFRLTGSGWPGSTVIGQEAGNGCASRVAAYLNPQLANAGLAQEYVFPDQQAWRAGVRTVVCEISASSGQLSSSVRQPG
ncbi:MAG TPA: septum formation family protein [Streptosporangiaceae bacterium]